MNINELPFAITDWSDVEATEHKGETGTAYWRTRQFGPIRVPITLAKFPLMAGVDHSLLIFNVVFFVVLVSAITQGWPIPVVARWLGLSLPSDYTAPISFEISSLRKVEGEIVDYTVGSSSHVAHKELRDLALPYGVAVTLIVRGC